VGEGLFVAANSEADMAVTSAMLRFSYPLRETGQLLDLAHQRENTTIGVGTEPEKPESQLLHYATFLDK
jgi:hypothetical protein